LLYGFYEIPAIAMKSFKVNFKLQHVATSTRPVQVIVNLNTKHEGKYLTVEKSMGLSLTASEWDASRRLPKDYNLATKFIRLEQEILDWLNFLASENEKEGKPIEDLEAKLIDFHRKKGIQRILEEKIKWIIRGEASGYVLASKFHRDSTQEPMGMGLHRMLYRLKHFKFSIIDESGRMIDPEKFFSNLMYQPDEMILEQTKPVIVKHSAAQHELIQQDERYRVPFFQYIVDVAEKKLIRQLLKPEGVADYRNKLSAQFKLWDDRITIGEMTDDVSAEFFYWLADTNEFSANYFANYKKWMKAVLRWAKIEDKLKLPFVETESLVYQQNKEKVSFPYLTEEMLQILIDMKFDPSEKHLEYTRDLFYLASYTGGLTFGDLSQAFYVQSRKVDGHVVNYISVTRNKTGVKAEIPLMDSVHDILKKYDFKFKEISNQHYNRNIQRICQMAGFNENFIRTRRNIKTKAQETVSTPYYELIGSHTARRNFCSNFFYHRKMEAQLIMQFSQHTKIESFMNYIKASANVKFDDFARRVIIEERNANGEKEN